MTGVTVFAQILLSPLAVLFFATILKLLPSTEGGDGGCSAIYDFVRGFECSILHLLASLYSIGHIGMSLRRTCNIHASGFFR